MRSVHPPKRSLVALLATLALSPASFARAQSPEDDDMQQTVARVAYFTGEVSYNRGDDPDNWQPASLNFPMTLGDRLYTGRAARLELQTEGGTLYLAPQTELAALNLTYEVKQFSLGIGSASFRIRRIDSGETFEVDTPNAAVTFDRPGEYRIDVDRDGNTRVLVGRGHVYVAAAGGEVPVEAGRLMVIDGIDSPVYDVSSRPRADSWDHWVEARARRFRQRGSRRYVTADISGVDELDEYGRWSEVSGYGRCWSPASVSADWQPYRAGRWAWQDPWGWSWVSSEPWGWAPYHYGRWINSRARWYWVPVRPGVRSVRYAPALVAFIGGSGASLSVSIGGGGYVGWFPLAPRDPLVPWWGSRARDPRRDDTATVTYGNRSHVTVVNRDTFLSGAPIGRSTIRTGAVLRQISSAPVVRGPLPLIPIASSIRVSTSRTGTAPRPPGAALNRPVVTRLAPAPAPAHFRDKLEIIRENRGAPVGPVSSERPSPGTKAIRPTNPVVVEPGRVTLSPRNRGAAGPAPVPITRGSRPGLSPREAPPVTAPEPAPVQPRTERPPDRRGGGEARPTDNEPPRRPEPEADRRQEQPQPLQLDRRTQHEEPVRPEPEPRARERQAPEEPKAVPAPARDQGRKDRADDRKKGDEKRNDRDKQKDKGKRDKPDKDEG